MAHFYNIPISEVASWPAGKRELELIALDEHAPDRDEFLGDFGGMGGDLPGGMGGMPPQQARQRGVHPKVARHNSVAVPKDN